MSGERLKKIEERLTMVEMSLPMLSEENEITQEMWNRLNAINERLRFLNQLAFLERISSRLINKLTKKTPKDKKFNLDDFLDSLFEEE